MKKPILVLLFVGVWCTVFSQQLTLIKDINPGSASSNISYLTIVNSSLFFVANDGVNGMELWKSDGTNTGTVMVKDINPGSANSSIGYLTNVNGILFFVANNGVNGTELWKSDGTEAGTTMIKDIRSGAMGSNPTDLVNMNGTVFFAANDGIKGTELWQSDGTSAGTFMVKDINPNSASSYPASLVAINNTVYFSADNGTSGPELWKSDGTAAGTAILKDIWSGSTGSDPANLVNVSGTLFFSATNSSNGTELWKSDGTSTGTVMVKDIRPGSSASDPFCLRNINGTLFFSADNGTNGTELWKSDGTSAGTAMIKDVWSGSQSGTIGNFSRFINDLVFTGNDGVNGNKTWESNGTSSGTSIASGIIDPGSGTLQELVDNYAAVYASVTHPETGKELWGVSYSVILPLVWLDFRGQLEKGDGVFNWTTEQEINTREFLLEKSTDGANYKSIGKVTAANSSGQHAYRFVEQQPVFPSTGILYYRIKQVNLDGKFTYSSIVTLSSKNNSAGIYPNPCNDHINLSLNLRQAQNIRWTMLDATGKTLRQETRLASSGSNVVPINTEGLPSGIYYIRLNGNYLSPAIQFVKR